MLISIDQFLNKSWTFLDRIKRTPHGELEH